MLNACERHVRDELSDLRDGVLFESTIPKQLLDDPLTDPDHHTLEDHVERQNLEGLFIANIGPDAPDDGLHVVMTRPDHLLVEHGVWSAIARDFGLQHSMGRNAICAHLRLKANESVNERPEQFLSFVVRESLEFIDRRHVVDVLVNGTQTPNNLAVQLLLGPEVVSDAAMGHAGFSRDVSDRDMIRPPVGEELQRRVHQSLLGVSVFRLHLPWQPCSA